MDFVILLHQKVPKFSNWKGNRGARKLVFQPSLEFRFQLRERSELLLPAADLQSLKDKDTEPKKRENVVKKRITSNYSLNVYLAGADKVP